MSTLPAVNFSIHRGNAFQRFCSRSVRWVGGNTDLIASVGILALNTLMVIARVVKRIPRVAMRSLFYLYNLTGLIGMNLQVKDLIKTGRDIRFAVKAGDRRGIALTVSKVIVKGFNILLTFGGCIAAVLLLGKRPKAARVLYKIMRPIALVALVADIIFQFIDYIRNKKIQRVLRAWTVNRNMETKIQNLVRDVWTLIKKPKSCGDLKDKCFAVEIVRQLDDYTLALFRKQWRHYSTENINEPLARQMLGKIQQAVKNKNTFTKNNIGLIFLGYVGMGVGRLFPNSLVQSTANWSLSALYTANLVYTKCKTLRLQTQPLAK